MKYLTEMLNFTLVEKINKFLSCHGKNKMLGTQILTKHYILLYIVCNRRNL